MIEQTPIFATGGAAERAAGAYRNNLEHLHDEFRRLDAVLQYAVAEFRAERQNDHFAEFRGLYISDAEVDELIASGGGGEAPERVEFAVQLAARRAEIQERVGESTRAGVSLRLPHLSAVFGLSPIETDALLLALAPEFDLRYQKLYAYLQDDISRRRPTVDLVLRLFCLTAEERHRAREYFGESSPLISNALVGLYEDTTERPAPLLGRSLKVDDRIVEFLRGSDRFDQRLAAQSKAARWIVPRSQEAKQLLLPEALGEALSKVTSLAASGAPCCCFLNGAAGAGKKSFAEVACRALGRLLLVLDVPALLKSPAPYTTLLRVGFREAMLYGAAVYLDGWHELLSSDGTHPAARYSTEQELARFRGLVFIGSYAKWQPSRTHSYNFFGVELPRPNHRQRRQLWEAQLGNVAAKEADIDCHHLAGAFRFTAGQIVEAVAQARMQAWLREGDDYNVTKEDLLFGCRTQSAQHIVAYATKIAPRRSWSDLVLPKDTFAQLREFCQQIRHRVRVYDEWGFDGRLSLGKGLIALFTGNSGTGKTLSAEVLASELGLDLYRVDLSCVVSKYIGETEKNLSRVFDDAQESNAILFFDEADALFGKRSEVKDAHDRYANIEINFLLQRVEEYEGAIILASNLSRNIDPAFLRRLHFSIEFPFPDETHRLRIWQEIFPAQAPRADDIDFEFLARKFRIAGGNIKNIALSAAFLAAEEGGQIRMAHLIRALKREYQKLGKVCDKTEFEKYYELVR